ncbi:helix-turn-helix domain-containing protein [Cupriavidus plantarum]|uniref:XRE family transcriptional regulator n=1 Tax=Cupriavidus plantarum TaxID=942865 RepID=A0A316ESP4_9BURK|nr:XRE family transcriptional regulator [Cupriavidus plantarum]PWK33717.1 XRE family transcriptional regulator [Cupriavidus plantarum]
MKPSRISGNRKKSPQAAPSSAPSSAPAAAASAAVISTAANEPSAPEDASGSAHGALGQRLRRHRLDARMTLAEVAERSGFGKAYLSRIENGRKVPPIATLARIAAVLGVEPGALLAETAGPGTAVPAWRGVSLVKRDDHRPTVLGGTAFGYNYLSVTNAAHGQALQAFLFSFPEEIDKYVFFEHDGEELLHVLEGKLEWQIGMDKYVLEPGDTIHFDSRIPHRGRSLSGSAKALMVMYAPTTDKETLA